MSYKNVPASAPLPDDDPPPYYDSQAPLLGDTVVVTRGSQRSVFGTLCSVLFIVPYLVLLCAPLVTIGFFASIHNAVLSQYNPGCLLFATYSVSSGFHQSQNGACSFTVFGEAAISVLGLILIVLTIVKTVWGKW